MRLYYVMNIKARICIPTYNNSTTIRDVVSKCSFQTDLPILVVDDGSDDDLRLLLKDLVSTKIEIIRHPENKGKGKALQTAIADSISKGFTHLVSIDADGQHPPSEISKIINEVKKHPWSLVIGKRNFKENDHNIPSVSKFGRKFSNYWVKYQTDSIISDSQSGLRCYPLFHVQNMSFYTKRFDFEIEILIRLLWKGVAVREVLIETIYPEKNIRISHFNKLWDNARISFLNIILVLLTIFRKGLSPKEMSWAIGLGIFIGCTPLWGLHAIIAFFVSIIFRLNFIALFIGTQISIPPLAPFLVLGSLYLGKHITGVHKSFLTYVLGTIFIGATLGITTGIITYFISKKILHKNIWTGKSRGGVFGNWFLEQVVKFLGLKAGYFCLFFIVPYFYIFAPKARKASIEYWKNIKPTYGPFKTRVAVLRHFYKFGTLLLDRVYQRLHPTMAFDHEEKGSSYIYQNIENGTPLILLGAHVGAWDMATVNFSDHNVLNKIKTVQFEFEKTKKVEHQILVNKVKNPIFDINEQLCKGKVLGMMADRPINTNYVLIPFFKKLFPFDTTSFRIAAATKTKLAFFFAFKQNNKYVFICTEPKHYMYAQTTDRDKQLASWLEEFALNLEKLLEEHPEQWLNFYPAWSYEPVLLSTQKANDLLTTN